MWVDIMIKSERIDKIVSALIIVFLFTSVDTLLFGTNKNQLFLYIPRIIAVLGIFGLPILFHGSLGKVKINFRELATLLLFLFLMTISSIINHENTLTFISRSLAIILGYSICRNVRKEVFFKAFDKAMIIISIGALIMELIAYLIPSLLLHLPKVYNTADKLHYTFYLSSVYDRNNLGTTLIRTSGIFWEPGAFAIYLVLAIFVQLFILDSPRIKTIILYLIALLFTFSTTGYISASALLLTYIFSERSSGVSKRLKRLFIAIIVVVLIISIGAENSELYSKVFGKLTSGTSSATTRYSSIFNGIKVVLDHPIFGVGSQSQDYMAFYVDSVGNQYSNGGYIITNTVVGYTVNYGVLFGVLFVIGTLKFVKIYASSKLEEIMLFIVFLMAYSGERFFSFLPFVFVFYGLKYKEIDYNENSSNKFSS